MNDSRLHKYAMGPAIKGSVAAVAAHVVLGVGDSKLALGGMVVGAPLVIGVSVAGASIAAELSHDFILAKIKPNASLADFEAKALAPALTAAATIGAAYLTIGPVTDMRAVAELAAAKRVSCDRCAYRCVVLTCVCPRMCCTSYSVRPELMSRLAKLWRKSCIRTFDKPAFFLTVFHA